MECSCICCCAGGNGNNATAADALEPPKARCCSMAVRAIANFCSCAAMRCSLATHSIRTAVGVTEKSWRWEVVEDGAKRRPSDVETATIPGEPFSCSVDAAAGGGRRGVSV